MREVAELLLPYIIACAVFVAPFGLALRVRPVVLPTPSSLWGALAALSAPFFAFVSLVVWDHLFLVVYELGPCGGAPDGGMYSTPFLFSFMHSSYAIDYLKLRGLARWAIHVAAGSGFAIAGAMLIRVHWSGLLWGPLVGFGVGARSSLRMWYTVTGYRDFRPPSSDAWAFVRPLAIETATWVAVGALVVGTLLIVRGMRARVALTNPPLQPTAPAAAAGNDGGMVAGHG